MRGGCSPHGFIFSRHPGAPRKRGQGPGSSSGIAWLSRDRDLAAYAAGVPTSCRRPGHFLLLAQEKVTKEKGPPESAPSGLRPPGTRSGSGLFDGAPAPTKRNRHPCRFPCGPDLHPPAASYGARKIKSDSRRLVQRSCTSHRGGLRCSCSRCTKSRQKRKATPLGGEFSTAVGKRSACFPLPQWWESVALPLPRLGGRKA